MTEPIQFEAVWNEVGALKVVLRSILDPERLKSPVDVRAARDEAESVVYKYWRKNLNLLANEDALAREYFSLFPLLAFCYQEVKRANLANHAIERAPQILREYLNLKPAVDAAFDRYLDEKIEQEYQDHLERLKNQTANQTTSPSDQIAEQS
jgi:hypothetical protein